MSDDLILCDISNHVATITLNRPKARNAFDPDMMNALTRMVVAMDKAEGVQALVLRGAGKVFCAGADIEHMKATASFTPEQNLDDARILETMLKTLGNCSKPLVAVVHGAAIGGGLGLAATADITLAVPDTVFGLSEVRLGILPAVIMPYVLRRIGTSHLSRYMLTGERFDSQEAQRIGLVHEVIAPEALEDSLQDILASLLKGGVEAQMASKKLLRQLLEDADPRRATRLTIEAIAAQRRTAEAGEGLAAFIEKRQPAWLDSSDPS